MTHSRSAQPLNYSIDDWIIATDYCIEIEWTTSCLVTRLRFNELTTLVSTHGCTELEVERIKWFLSHTSTQLNFNFKFNKKE